MTEIVELSSPSSSSEPNDEISLREDLEECLTNLKSPGDFALFEPLSQTPNPGLYLSNGGTIGLPLSDRDADAIIAASHEAPFGKGEQTIVDATVRKTWELSPGDFELRNPAWKPFLETIVAKVSEGLGVDAAGKGVTAQLYKLLLYDEGAMFKAHQDSEKAPRMFGTLVIALPSRHEGGEVHVSHAGKTKVLETSKMSEFESSYLAWFSDVTHEVKPVTSGRRLVLTYNLIHTTLSSRDLGAGSNKAMAKLRLIFSWWKEHVEKYISVPSNLAFLFEHQYTDASLSFNGLKGNDHQVAAVLREISSEYGFCFYLTSLERTVEGGCDEYEWEYGGSHEIIDEIDSGVTLNRVVDLNGSEIATDLDFDQENFIQSDPFEGLEPDDEDCSGYTGNEGVTMTHFYRRTAAILVPKSHRIDFLYAPTKKVTDATEYWKEKKPEKPKVMKRLEELISLYSNGSNDAEIRDELEQICKMVIRRTKIWKNLSLSRYSHISISQPFSDTVLKRVVDTAILLGDKEIFTSAYEICATQPSLSIHQSVGIALVRYDLKALLPKISSNLSLMNVFNDRFRSIEDIESGVHMEGLVNIQDQTIFTEWIESEKDKCITSMPLVTPKDGSMLVDLSKRIPAQAIFDKILPVVKRNAKNTPMALVFLSGLLDAVASSSIPQDVADAIFKDVIVDVGEHFNLVVPASETNKRVAYGSGLSRPIQPPIPSSDESYRQICNSLSTVLHRCCSIGLGSAVKTLVAKIVAETSRKDISLFEVLYFPFLKLLKVLLARKNELLQDPQIQQLFQLVLAAYIVRFVQIEPKPPTDWVRLAVHCTHCTNPEDCRKLNQFLSSPTEQVCRFAMPQPRRKHIERNLYGYEVKCETEKHRSPHTLVVTKVRSKFAAAHAAWRKRCDVARKHLRYFEQQALKDLLPEWYDAIVSLDAGKLEPTIKSIQIQTTPQPLGELGNAPNRILPPISKRKVPPEVIVLDD